MNYKIKGKIKSIGEEKTLSNGAKVLDYLIETEDQYNNIYSINLYKSADKLEHFDNFVKYNKVGDLVECEFSIRTQEYNGKYYTNLSHWKTTKIKEEINEVPF